MRLSRYTTVLPITSHHYVIFSAISDTFIVCHKSLLQFIPNSKYRTSSERLERQMQEIEAVCDDNFDEVLYLRNLIEATDGDQSEFHLHVNPTLDCNFKCWYCYEEHQIRSKISSKVIDSIILLAEKEIENNNHLKIFNLSFFGGEPLMYYSQAAGILISAIRMLCDKFGIYFRCHFTTNGYLLTPSILHSLQEVDVSFQITLDGGRECHNMVRFSLIGRGTYDTILQNIKLLAQEHHEVLVRINYTSNNINSIINIIEDLKAINLDIRKYIQIDFQRVWQDRPTITEDEVLIIITSLVDKLKVLGYKCAYTSNIGHGHVRNSCYGDKKNHLLVNYDGNVFFCTARDFKPENRAGILNIDGSVKWNMEIYNNYFTNKFHKKICHTCKIAPLCGGGCRQRAKESGEENRCIYGYSQEDINQMILNRFIVRYVK